jgi:cellulose synthase operon protein C
MRSAFVGAVVIGGLVASGPVWADVPPLSNAQVNPNLGGSANTDKLLAEAQKALKAGNIRLALINLKNAVSSDPRNGSARAQLGIVLLQAADGPAAERELRQARKDGAPELIVLPPLFEVMLARNEYQLLLDQFPDPGAGPKGPSAADILKARALALQSLKKGPEATDAMDRSLAVRRDSHGLLTRARISILQGNVPEASKFADEAIAKSDNPEAMLFKVGMFLASNDNTAALDLANQLLAKYPNNLQARFARIEVYTNLKQDAKAKAEVDDIVAKYPNAFLGTYYKALLMARAGDSKGAWNLAQTLPADVRDAQPRIAVMIAQMAMDSGNAETGASILNRILLRNPNLAVVRIRLATLRLKQNSFNEALSVLGPVKDSSDTRILELLSNIYLKLNRNNDALDALKRMDAAGKGRADVKRSVALLEIQMGQTEQGIRDLTQAVAKEPANPTLVAPLIDALARAQRFPEALAVADRLGSDPKQRGTALVYRASILMLQHDNAGAQAAFDKAVQSDPKNLTALYSRAEFLESTQRFAEANRDLRAILSLDKNNMAAFLKLAGIAAQQGEDQNVRAILAQAIASAPQNAAPRIALIRYFNVRQNYKDALTAADDLVRAQPKNTDGLALLGQAQYALGQKKEAVATYRRLVSLMPSAAAPQVLLGNALSVAGDQAGAARALETAVKLSPNAPDVKGAQINLQLSQGHIDAAVASARSFQTVHPGENADLLLADTLERAKQPDQATAVLNKSFSAKSTSAVLLRLVRSALRSNDKKRAGDLMSNWVASNPNDAGVRLEYATFLMQQNDNAKAIAQYQAVLKQDPNNGIALNNLGWLIQGSDPKRALSLLTLAAKLSPNSADIADTLGWVQVQQKDVVGGLAMLNRAHSLSPQDGEITYHLILALDANSKRDAARGLLKSLLSSGVKFKDLPAATQLSLAWH